MTSKMPVSRTATAAAVFETDEQSARRIADLVAESYPAGQVAVAVHEEAVRRWRVAMHFPAAPDENAVRALTAVAAGPSAAKALRFKRVAAKDWVSESVAKLQPVEARRFIIHGHVLVVACTILLQSDASARIANTSAIHAATGGESPLFPLFTYQPNKVSHPADRIPPHKMPRA